MSMQPTRRRLLTSLSLAGAAGLLPGSRVLVAEGALEVTTVRLPRIPATCLAPQYIAEQLLRADGFTDVHWVDALSSAGFTDVLGNGTVDFTQQFVAALVTGVDSGDAVTGLAPIHVGCLELIASERVRTIADLKGKSVGVEGIGASSHLFAAVTAAHIGLDPVKDITWVASESPRRTCCLPREIWTPLRYPRRFLRIFVPGGLAMSLPTARWTIPGRNTSAAFCRGIATSCAIIRLRPSVWYALF